MTDQHHKHRSHLPPPNPARRGPVAEQLRPPPGAPNVLVILIEDVGFGASSVFGGPCQMPVAQKLAAKGLKYNRFHTTAHSSPTRQALLTGRNHHSTGMGGSAETNAAGYSSMLPSSMAPLARTLHLNGYSTAQFGKAHEAPGREPGSAGQFDPWPTGGGGFEYFYGYIGGEANQFSPPLYEGTTPVVPKKSPEQGYRFTEDMTDKAIGWLSQHAAQSAEQPFFVYFAPGATHTPHHVPKEFVDKYKGKFDAGWDAVREETFTRQKQQGVIPAASQLTPRPREIPAWSDVPDALQQSLRRQMEVYAGFLEYCDQQVGRVLEHLEQKKVLENTLVFYIIGDNTASADAMGWAHAMSTPYQWSKQTGSHFGGTRNGTIVSWPNRIKTLNEVRTQFHHVIDVAPTILEAAGLPHPVSVHGVQQEPIEGVSMLYSFDHAKAEERRDTQYFEMFGNRGIYHKGWTAVTKQRTPWFLVNADAVALHDDVWELYDTTTDPSQSRDVASQMPEKLHELQRIWLSEASRYKVLPLDDRPLDRQPGGSARPTVIKGTTQILDGGMGRLAENGVLSIKNRSHAVTAESEVPETGAEGVIIAQGTNAGGWALYAKKGKLKYCYNLGGKEHVYIESTNRIPAGPRQVRMEFAYAGGGPGKGGSVTLFVDGKKVGEGQVPRTHATRYSADDGVDVGKDTGTPVSPDYGPRENAFNGRVRGVKLSIEPRTTSEHRDPDDAIRVAMAPH